MTLPASGPLSLNDIQTEFGGTNPIGMNEYYAGGGLVPPGTTGTFGAVPSSGALSVQNFYGTSNYIPVYIEELFQTWLYTGNGSTQTITNGIDLAGEGGLAWFAGRNTETFEMLFDSARGVTKYLLSGLTNAEATSGAGERLTAYNSNGFSLGTDPGFAINASGYNYVSWTFRKQPKFFDIVTYTGDGTENRAIAHDLGSVPGCIIVKRTDGVGSWFVFHRSLGNGGFITLNATSAFSASGLFGDDAPDENDFYLNAAGSGANAGNASGFTYVAYLFAHDAGGFGLTGTDNVISCGSVTVASGSGITNVNLGYEPQWLLAKISNQSGYNWAIYDTMRGWVVTTGANNNARLNPNNADAETSDQQFQPNATGFQCNNSAVYTGSSTEIIYIAIRRGPMKVPTTGTSVFNVDQGDNSTVNPQFRSNFVTDFGFFRSKNEGNNWETTSRLQGKNYMRTNTTTAEAGDGDITWDFMNGFYGPVRNSDFYAWMFQRAPGFFDVVCYTGTGANRTVAHNLAAVPELMIVKKRSATDDWAVYAGDNTDFLQLNKTAATEDDNTYWNDTSPTSTVFSVGTNADVNTSAATYVAYLFASCPGVSKVGSFTGTGATQVINCGFTGGARFVLIKATSTTGNWYVWDSARGIVAGNDPYLLLNSTAAEVTTTDWVDTAATGFELSNAGGNLANSNGVSYIFLAIS
jgi:hypothetical protein